MSTATSTTTCLRPVPFGTGTLAACKGSRTVTDATKVFRAGIDGDFKRWNLDGRGPDTPDTPFATDDLIANAPFAEMFAGSKFFTPSQMVQFCKDHSDKLSQVGLTFFPLEALPKDVEVAEDDKAEYRFVADVLVRGGGLSVYVYHFSLGYVWLAEVGYHVVRPAPQAL